ncbi:MAG: hypothetical protein KBS68_00675 [Clostridiales bacterium]|nr:hypothetical protein [Candidatus Crickella merdequi]
MSSVMNYVGNYYNEAMQAQENSLTVMLEFILYILLMIACWKIFTKAGEPGWTALIPFYNLYKLFKITMGNGFFVILCFLPFFNFLALILLGINTARAFNRPPLFALGLILLPSVFLIILGFSNAQYVGPGGFGDYRPDEDYRENAVDFRKYMDPTPNSNDVWEDATEVQTVDFEVEEDN